MRRARPPHTLPGARALRHFRWRTAQKIRRPHLRTGRPLPLPPPTSRERRQNHCRPGVDPTYAPAVGFWFRLKQRQPTVPEADAEPSLIRNFSRLGPPNIKRGPSLVRQQLPHRNGPLGNSESHLLIYEGVIKPGLRRIHVRRAEPNHRWPSPVNCPQAHGARLTAGIKLAPM
jgi:hypothetical protein